MKTLNWKQTGFLTLALGMGLSAAANAAPAPRLVINGTPFETRVEPINQDGRVLVPLRDIFENLGARVNYNDFNRTITARRQGTVVEMKLGSPRARVDGRPVRLDVPADSINGRTMVPLRFVSEALGAYVNYNQNRNVVRINDRDDRGPGRDSVIRSDDRDRGGRDWGNRDGGRMDGDRMDGGRDRLR